MAHRPQTAEQQLQAAYSICRGIARRAARNFYYGFLVLPREKRDAISAVYAFMRHCDDIADNPALPADEKLRALNQYRTLMFAVLEGKPTDDPVLLALADAQRRFRISTNLLDQLVNGTVMDVETPAGTAGAPVAPYRDFEALRTYCYHVASVVGLICIRIFGYKDPAAEPLAENCGVAFQLTNIIRDVKEDAQMGRVYLPVSDLQEFGRSPEELAPQNLQNGFDPIRFRPVLQLQAERARELYDSADQLLPLIDEDSQPALWVLVSIYRRLLERITQHHYNVFEKKIRVPRLQKFKILAQGFAQRFL
jgi:phytoene synthase